MQLEPQHYIRSTYYTGYNFHGEKSGQSVTSHWMWRQSRTFCTWLQIYAYYDFKYKGI